MMCLFRLPVWILKLDDTHLTHTLKRTLLRVSLWACVVIIFEFIILYKISRGVLLFGPEKSWALFVDIFLEVGVIYILYVFALSVSSHVTYRSKEAVVEMLQSGVLTNIIQGRPVYKSTEDQEKQIQVLVHELPLMCLNVLSVCENTVKGLLYICIGGIITLAIDPLFFLLLAVLLGIRISIEKKLGYQKSEYHLLGLEYKRHKITLGQAILNGLNFLKLNHLNTLFIHEWKNSLSRIRQTEYLKFKFNQKVRVALLVLELVLKGCVIVYLGHKFVVLPWTEYHMVYLLLLLPKLQNGVHKCIESWQLRAFDRERASFLEKELAHYREKNEGQSASPVDSYIEIKAIHINSVTYSWQGGAVLFKDFSMSVKRGEKILILGNNGSGKSTLFLMMCGLIKPEKGKIHIVTESDETLNISAVLPQTGVLFQHSAYADINTESFIKHLKSIPDAKKFIPSLNIQEELPSFSFGERRKLALLQITQNFKNVYLLDEPEMGLDVDTGKKLLLEKFIETDKTVIVFSPENKFALPFDRIISLDQCKGDFY